MRLVFLSSALLPLCLLACTPTESGGNKKGAGGDGDCAPDVAGKQSLVTLYADLDGDGFTIAEGVEECIGDDVPTGYLTEPTTLVDCDDTSVSVNPIATEIPGDGIDQDCDGEDPILLPDDVFYVDIDDPDCQDETKGTVEAPNCSMVAASDLSDEGDTIWVASDAEYPAQYVPAGRNYLGGFDASAGWVRDTTSHPTIINQTWQEPEEITIHALNAGAVGAVRRRRAAGILPSRRRASC